IARANRRGDGRVPGRDAGRRDRGQVRRDSLISGTQRGAPEWIGAEPSGERATVAAELAVEAVPATDVGLHADVGADGPLGVEPAPGGHALTDPRPEVAAADQYAGGDDRQHQPADDRHLDARGQPAKPD